MNSIYHRNTNSLYLPWNSVFRHRWLKLIKNLSIVCTRESIFCQWHWLLLMVVKLWKNDSFLTDSIGRSFAEVLLSHSKVVSTLNWTFISLYKMKLVTWFQILDKVVCSLGKSVNLSLLLPAMSKYLDRLGSLVMVWQPV